MKKKFLFGIFILLGIVTVIATNSFLSAHEGEEHGAATTQSVGLSAPIPFEKESQLLLGVRTEFAREQLLSHIVRATGRVVPRTQGKAEILPPQTGRMVADPQHPMPNLGDRVVKGQVVAAIEQTLSGAEQLQVLAEKSKAEAELEQAQKEFNRLQSISQVVSQKDLQAAEIRVRAAERVQQLYSATVGELRSGDNARRYYITSPISGIITAADVTVGEQVESNKVLFEVVDLSTLWVDAQIYEIDLARVEKASRAKISTQTYADLFFDGKLFNLGQVVDPTTRTVRVIYEVNNSAGKLRVGMFADVAIAVGAADSVLAVPRSAVVEVSGKRVVFTHIAPEFFRGNEVQLGDQDGAFVEIKAGIKAGDRIVTAGNYQLKAVSQQGG